MARTRRAGLLILAAAALAACHDTTPTSPETGPVLVLAYTGPCGHGDALVSVDGVAVGRVQIPGAFTWALSAGTHRVAVGSSPEMTVQMPGDRDLSLTNQPSPCP